MSQSDVLSSEPLAQAPDKNQEARSLSETEELLLHQLVQTRYWYAKTNATEDGSAESDSSVSNWQSDGLDNWNLTKGISLHAWQQDAVDRWFLNERRGVIKVVTGAGKTILGLAIAERLQREDKNLRVAIVVPTTVLLYQWQSVLARHGNIPLGAIGLMGGGHNDTFDQERRVLICVLNSASKKLHSVVAKAGISDSLLLVADECHRAGAAQMQQVFKTKRKYNLGLSATPERDDDPAEDGGPFSLNEGDGQAPFAESVVGRELGDVVYEMNYAEAIRTGVLPPFMIIHYGLSLQPSERDTYEKLSREIRDLRRELETSKRRGLALIRWCRSKAAAGNPKAARLVALTTQRKRLLYRIKERSGAVSKILQMAFQEDPDTKAILFHESIDEVMNLFLMLRQEGFSVVAEHSDFPDEMRAESLRLFREGRAQVIVSARSLIEGFNIPSADLGIIVAASSSVRQRVQTLGRLLRKMTTGGDAEKKARLYVLYAHETVDDRIYEKADWKEFVGADRNEYFVWPNVTSSNPIQEGGPPRTPASSDSNLDLATLRQGEPYMGNLDEGTSYTLDTQGNISDENGKFVTRSSEIREILRNSLKKGGRFRVTPVNRFVIELRKTQSGWEGIYLGQLKAPLEVVESKPETNAEVQYSPGDRYPLERVEGKTFAVLQRDKRLIALKGRDGIRFVVDAKGLSDPSKGKSLQDIQASLARLHSSGRRLSKVTVTREGHVVYVSNNEAYFIGNAPEGADGFQIEEGPNSH